MLSELGQRLIGQYHRVVPSMVAEARYDVGKSIVFLEKNEKDDVKGLERLKKLHVLRMLADNTQFVWSAKACESPLTIILLSPDPN